MIIIGDVHGNYDTLQKLLSTIPDEEKTHVCFVGDLIDRGPKSREVVEFVKQGVEAGKFSCVKGNHEVMMIEAGPFAGYLSDWLHNGGIQCLESYPEGGTDLIVEHMEWMKSLPLFVSFKDLKNDAGRYLVVSHSSVSRVWKWSKARRTEQAKLFEQSIVWNRQPPIDVKSIYNVFGHTIMENGPRITKCYANVDTGCYYDVKGYGVLTAMHWPSMKVYQQVNIDKPKESTDAQTR